MNKKFNEKRYLKRECTHKVDLIRIKKIKELIKSGNKKILDVGCYDGIVSEEFIKDNMVVGLDHSIRALINNKLKEKCVSDAIKIPMKKDTFDYVIAGEIIEHIFDTDKFIKELKRVLKKKGELIITTPNLAGFGSRIMLLIGKKPFMIENSLDKNASGHIRYFTFKELKTLLEKHGFKRRKVWRLFGLFGISWV